jgi:hypothetical protein
MVLLTSLGKLFNVNHLLKRLNFLDAPNFLFVILVSRPLVSKSNFAFSAADAYSFFLQYAAYIFDPVNIHVALGL